MAKSNGIAEQLPLDGPHTPAVFALVAYTGEQGDAVLRRRLGVAVIQLGNLLDFRHGIGAGAELRRQRDRIAPDERVNVGKVAVRASVVVE